MKQFKSVLAMLLALIMILSCVASAFAADKTDAEDVATTAKPAALRELKGYKSEKFLASNSYRYAADEVVRAIVILSGDPEADVADAGSERALNQHLTLMKQHESVRKSMSGIKYELAYDFTALTNGFSCDVAYGDLDKIAALDGVEAVYIANHYEAPVLEKKPETKMAVSNAFLTGIDAVYGDYGVDGTGMVIAVLDTGLNVTHEAFADADGNCAAYGVLTAEDVSLASMPGKFINAKVPFTYDYADFDDDVTDYNGHGTHVSGIATGCAYDAEEEAYTFLGAASGAQLVNMKIFHDDQPGTNSDIYFAALDDAYRLGVDVINMSIGAQNGFTYDSELETEVFGNIYERLNKAGIVLSVAGGNEYSMAQYSPVGYVGPEYQDYGTVGSPATYEGNTSVASVENYMYPSYVITTDAGSFPFTDSSDDGLWMATFGGQTVEYVNVLNAEASDFATGSPEDYDGVDVSGKIAVVKRGDITFEEKVENAANAGAIGCIVVNNQAGVISMAIETYEIPAVSVQLAAQDALVNASVYELTVPTEKEYVWNDNAGLMSDFSNWGTTPMLTLDPAITSVGGQIYSSVNTGDTDYDVYSGTSMATPNYAGTIATVMQALGEMDKKERADLATALLESTAEMLFDADGYPYSPRKQGAGLASAANALYALEESAYIANPLQELGDDPDRTGHYTFTAEIVNDSTYDLFLLPEAYLLFDYVANAGTEAEPYWVNTQTSDIAYAGADGYGTVTYEINGTDVTDGFALAAGENASVKVDIQLDDDIKAYFDETFPNGNFVEGFVCFNDVENDNGEVIYFDDDYNAYKLDEIGAYQVDDGDNYVPILDGENKIYYTGDLADLSPYTYYTTHATLLAYYGDWTDGDVLEAADFRDYIDAEYWVNTTEADEEGNTYADYGYTGLDLLDYYTSPSMGYSAVVIDGAPQNLVWYLGDNLYDYVPFYEEHISFSTLDTDADDLYANGFYLEPYQLRNCKNLIMTVSNKETGEVYFVDNTPYLPKAYYDTDNAAWSATGAFYWDGTDAEGNYVPSGTLVNVNFDAILPYGETEKDGIWSFDCLVDYTAPVIESAKFDKKTSTVTVTASDENYLANILLNVLTIDKESGELAPTVFDAAAFSSDVAGESFTATFDVSYLLDNEVESVFIDVLDYATNLVEIELDLNCEHENTEVRDAVEATCTEDGYTGDTYCLDCGEKIAEGEVIPAAGHTPGEPVQENLVPATYSKAGSYDEVVYCTVCKAELSREAKTLDPLGYGKCYVKDFTDCPAPWYHEAIDYMVDAGLMNGVGDKKFAPNGTMTRGMIVTVLYRMAGSPEVTEPSTFKDVEAGKWYADAIAWAQKNEVVNGYSADKFGPNDPVTREQIATILYRYENMPEAKEADMSKFSDTAKISAYAKDAMEWAVGEGILSGDNGKLKPTDNATRAEFACMIMRYRGGFYACENLKDKYE